MPSNEIAFLWGALFGAIPIPLLLWMSILNKNAAIEWEQQKRALEVEAVRNHWMSRCEEIANRRAANE